MTTVTGTNDDTSRAEEKEEEPIILPRQARVDGIDKVIAQKKLFQYPAIITDQIKEIQAYHNIWLKELNKWEADNSNAVKDEKSQVQCKPLVNSIGIKTTELSKVWEEYQDLVQLVKLDCGRAEGEYFQWFQQLHGTETQLLTTSWEYMKHALEDKKNRLSKCKPKWEAQIENKIEGGDKCKDATADSVSAFKDAMKELSTAKEAYFKIQLEWTEAWKDKYELDKMCKAKSSSFRFLQTSSQAEEEEHQRALWEHHQNLEHAREDLLKNQDFKQLEKDLYNLQFEQSDSRFAQREKEEKPVNECQDCIKVPQKYAFFEVNKYWKILLAMQTELGELWQDINNYNSEAGSMIAWCDTKKKDLEVIITAITQVHKLKEQTTNDWVSCLKKRAKQNPLEVKTNIHETIKKVMELIVDIVEMEKVIGLDECEDWLNFVSGNIVEKQYGDCKANADLIKKMWASILIKIKASTKKQSGPDGALFLATNAENERLKLLDATKACPSVFSLKIDKDVWEGDKAKPRKPCIVMDEDNTDVRECYQEEIVTQTDPVKLDILAQQNRVLVWVGGKMFFCNAPADTAPVEGEAPQPGEFDPKKQARPIFNLLNPYVCLPGGVSSQDPYVCRVGSEIQSANQANFQEFKATACDQDYKEKFGPCAKVHYSVSSSSIRKAIVQQMAKDSFQVCNMFDPNSPIEQKFDFTDRSLCDRCYMFEMQKPETVIVKKMAGDDWPKLKGEADKFISEYIYEATHFDDDDCYMYIDKEALSQMSPVQGEFSTETSIPQPYNRDLTKKQFVPGTKCKWAKSGDDKSTWKIEEVYFDPKIFDFAGQNRAKIDDLFKIASGQEANLSNDTGLKHKLVGLSDYFCLEMKLMNQHANVLQGMWNWVYNLEWLAGGTRNDEMTEEWASSSKIGYEALHKLEQRQRWPKIWQEMQVRWSTQAHCFRQMQATLQFYPTPPRQDYTDLFYQANFNFKHANDLKLYKPREIEHTKKLWNLEDTSFPMADQATWQHEFDETGQFVSTEMNFATYWGSQGYRYVWFQFFAVIRNTYNQFVYNHPKNTAHKWGCSIFTQYERFDIGRSQYQYNWFGREWGNLCMYNDRAIKMQSRIEKVEADNKVADYFQVCLHNWKKDWNIVQGPDGDNFLTDIQCMNLKDFTAALKSFTPPSRFKEKDMDQLVQLTDSKEFQKMDMKGRLKMLKMLKKEGTQKEVDPDEQKKKWTLIKDFTQVMSIPQQCPNLKKFEGREGQHLWAKCK